MTPALKASARHWLAGIAIAFTGVTISRLLAPFFDGRARALLTLTGELIALTGLFVIILGIRRRLRSAQAQLPNNLGPLNTLREALPHNHDRDLTPTSLSGRTVRTPEL